MNQCITVTQLAKNFGQQVVLKDINFSLPEQSISAFLGNNGAGKSTTMRILAGLLPADAGQVSIFGQVINTASRVYKRQLGCLIDAPAYYNHLTLLEFLKLGCRLKQLKVDAAYDALNYVDILDAKNKLISTCSLGMKQRVCLAFALLGFPKLLLLDEPTNGLDPHGRADFRALIQSLPKQYGCSVFLSSHLLDDVEKLANHIVVIEQGQITAEGALSSLLIANNTLELRTTNPTKAKHILLQQGFVVNEASKDVLTVSQLSEADCPKLHQALFSNQIGLYHSTFKKPSLNDFFMHPSVRSV